MCFVHSCTARLNWVQFFEFTEYFLHTKLYTSRCKIHVVLKLFRWSVALEQIQVFEISLMIAELSVQRSVIQSGKIREPQVE